MEWLRPGEGEDTAALRLLSRLPRLYGSRFFDILLLDAPTHRLKNGVKLT
jgi:hypothetical protein